MAEQAWPGEHGRGASMYDLQYSRRCRALIELDSSTPRTCALFESTPASVYELQKLCDAVPSYPTAEALQLHVGFECSELRLFDS